MLSTLMSAIAPRGASAQATVNEASGSTRFATAVSIASDSKVAPASPPASSGGGERSGAEGQFRRGYPTGPHVPPLGREPAKGDATASPEEGRWMSAEVTQPNAPSFAEAASRIRHPNAALDGAGSDRRASLDYLVSSIKAAKETFAGQAPAPAEGPDTSPAMRHALAAYSEF